MMGTPEMTGIYRYLVTPSGIFLPGRQVAIFNPFNIKDRGQKVNSSGGCRVAPEKDALPSAG